MSLTINGSNLMVQSEPPLLDLWIPGTPATFATRGEIPWRAVLADALPSPPTDIVARGLIVEFAVGGASAGWHAVDLDNLCEPLFSVLVNQRGWFSGRRPNIEWFRVTKRYAGEPGVQISILSTEPVPIALPASDAIVAGVYSGPMPMSARDAGMAAWVQAGGRVVPMAERFTVLLEFNTTTLNIGDIATGRVKNIVDCLYPVLGGKAGAPEDWRIHRLQVQKGMPTAPDGAFRLAVWPS